MQPILNFILMHHTKKKNVYVHCPRAKSFKINFLEVDNEYNCLNSETSIVAMNKQLNTTRLNQKLSNK